MTAIITPAGKRGATNEKVELARYATGAGERVIYGQRVCGVVRLVDVPADERGDSEVLLGQFGAFGGVAVMRSLISPPPGRQPAEGSSPRPG